MSFSVFRVFKIRAAALLAVAFLAACSDGTTTGPKTTITDADKFVTDAEKSYLEVSIKESQATWVQENFITHDTNTIAAATKEETIKVMRVINACINMKQQL